MSFKDLNLKEYYNNAESDLIKEFYEPTIIETKIYKRATGFFSSSSFWCFIEGLKVFLEKKDSKIYLIVSPELAKEDIAAILSGEKAKEDIAEGFFISRFLEKNKYESQFNFFAWLIYKEKLEIKIAIKNEVNKYGIFHDKFAILEDEVKNKIAFHGSLNESKNGIINNLESIDLFMDWNEYEVNRITRIEKMFDSLWNNEIEKWKLLDIPIAIKEKIIEERKEINIHKKMMIPQKYKLRSYQNEAIKAWQDNGFSGILEMATGSGKTLTAIFAMVKLIEALKTKKYSCGIVIVVPYKNLLEQWLEDLKEFNINPIKCYEKSSLWKENLKLSVMEFNKYDDRELFVITTNSTYLKAEFRNCIEDIKRDYIFCVDEMHHLLGESIYNKLPKNTELKLGLTATLGNEDNDERVKKLKEYFRGSIYEFTIEDAIKNECLTRYYYYPIFVELTDDEIEQYRELNTKIAKISNFTNGAEGLKILINKRNKIIFNAENKKIRFKSLIEELKQYERTLVYCGDKREADERYIYEINRMLCKEGIKAHTYTAELGNKDRKSVLKRLKNGELNVITAIRCLDEGVNIPNLDCAVILASNNDSKQFIQRRGRILRKAEGKDYAYIYDFIVIPTLDQSVLKKLDSKDKKMQFKIVKKELERVKEFASICENKLTALIEVSEILKLFN